MKKFKKGDEVYVMNNSVWGMVPMKVTAVWDDDAVSCKHPDFIANGWFHHHAVAGYTPARAAKLRELSKLLKQVDLMKKDLFGPDRG